MAYNLQARFPLPPKGELNLDPGAYQNSKSSKVKLSRAPFLSNTARNTQAGAKIWTHALYQADLPPKIPNCTSMMSKRPRFPYEALSKQDLEDILCRCGVQTICECDNIEKETEIVCQGLVRRRLFKGHPPRSSMEEGLSAPSKRDHGFKINPDGTQKRITSKPSDESPPFYDIRVDESTAFYQGCKWSHWTSKRSSKKQELSPGPAEYSLERKPTQAELCAEAVRSYNKKRSKQLRFIEMIQQQNILEGRPGPSAYSPKTPPGTNLHYLGPKAERFPQSSEQRPGPADHWIRRHFDLPLPPLRHCRAKLPEPSFFGVKAVRFKPRKEEGPSPATYNPSLKQCSFMQCSSAPFGSSAERFKKSLTEDDDESFTAADDVIARSSEVTKVCPTPTWEFKSKTIRIRPLEKNWNEPSPADLPQTNAKVKRSRQLQYTAPFFTSDGRFLPWANYMPVFKYDTPGPCYYELEKPKCNPAVCRGPLFRSRRFPPPTFATPGPGEYDVAGGVESVLNTHNKKLQNNIDNQHKFHWEPPVDLKKLSYEEQESMLLKKSIGLLDVDIFDSTSKSSVTKKTTEEAGKPKLLRCFLYCKPIANCV